MASPSFESEKYLVLFLMCLLALSVPAHLLLLKTLRKFKAKPLYESPFYVLLFSLTCNDVLYCMAVVPLKIWTNHFGGHLSHPVQSATFFTTLCFGFYTGNETVLVAMAINRVINMCWPLSAVLLWPAKATKLAIAFQFFGCIAMAIPNLVPGGQSVYLGDSAAWMPWPANQNATVYLVHNMCSSIFDSVSALLLIICYATVTAKLIHYSLTNESGSQNESFENDIKLGVQGFFLASMAVGQSVLFLLYVFGIRGYVPMIHVIIFNANFCIVWPFVAFLVSPTLRGDALIVMGFKPNQIGPGRIINVRQLGQNV